MKKITFIGFCICLIGVLFVSCKSDEATEGEPGIAEQPTEIAPPVVKKNVRVPGINRDSAKQNVLDQLIFGPRVPNSRGHQNTKAWIINKLNSYDVQVTEQDFKVEDYKGTVLDATNIIGAINPDHPKRIILAAHWDTRFMADQDPQRIEDPIIGADDGASGVAVLLEIARTISENPIDLGVDLIFFDAEDQGEGQGKIETWCLGSQYWGQNPHIEGYEAKFGILLDMVGAKGAIFQTENLNGVFEAEKVQKITRLYNKVWNLAQSMGRGNMFLNRQINALTDDHYFVNLHTNIPMIDIVNRPIESTTGFGPHWHTHRDDFSIIDKNVLGIVGQLVTAVIYKESGNSF